MTFDVDEEPHVAAFMANPSTTGSANGTTSSQVNEVQIIQSQANATTKYGCQTNKEET